jgi:hypothetical protein
MEQVPASRCGHGGVSRLAPIRQVMAQAAHAAPGLAWHGPGVATRARGRLAAIRQGKAPIHTAPGNPVTPKPLESTAKPGGRR